ncbi:U2-associated protein SR140 [Fistulifera solaris]|uniref:U2-associated protein SR140 n=1 Tax=Fistulifera solaris TaxID=1519565 RepID=A0A1Z5KPW7_FISSO|nr:U2-associated protein SR140 [Fistulifera solaris]|eukprot:GAX28336.1 U2-associated protein SR140 [Fistulifera solaris]
MWARTPEERSRNRHSGFVCFRYRADAEAALKELDDTDAFRVGRYIMVRWGRHVPNHQEEMSSRPNGLNAGAGSIEVLVPADSEREHFISRAAFVVASDEHPLEQKLRGEQDRSWSDAERRYYLWRVWSFSHGDTWESWRTEPFVMEEGGPVWIPPSLHHGVETKEVTTAIRKENPDGCRRHVGTSDGQDLTPHELTEFRRLFRKELTTSRGSICQAMAFCFEKSGSFRHICDMLEELLKEEPTENVPKDVAMEQKTAQLFLLSDILFNSQQPGVRNAFRYRDAIEKMAPDVFTAVGRMEWGGRLTRNKLAVEISSILAAWTNWSVYSPSFLDELQDRFEGRKIKSKFTKEKTSLTQYEGNSNDGSLDSELDDAEMQPSPSEGNVIEPLPEERVEVAKIGSFTEVDSYIQKPCQRNDYATNRCSGEDSEVDGDRIDLDDVDGESLEEDSKNNATNRDTNRDVDGELHLDDENIDKESIGEELDGEPLSDENIDGESIDDDAL